MNDYMKEAERLFVAAMNASFIWSQATIECDAAKALREHGKAKQYGAALLAHIQRGAVPEGDDGKRVLREVFALCEDTEAKCHEDPSDFNRGRSFEAKGIARAIGAWYQEEFCGRTHMGEPAAPDHFRNAAKMVAAPAEVPMPEPIGFIDSNDDETWATLTQNAHELATLKLRSTVFHVSQMRTYGAACRAAGEAAGYARGGVKGADKLAHTLMMCRETFKRYADLHAAKCTDDGRDKAAANMRLVAICDAALLRGGEAVSDRHELQAAGTHPAPCARHCESTAYEIEMRRLGSEVTRLSSVIDHQRDEAIETERMLRAELAASRERFAKAAAAFEREQDRALAAEVRAETAETALAASREREVRVRVKLEYALRQNDLDMLLTGDEIRDCRAALAEGAQG